MPRAFWTIAHLAALAAATTAAAQTPARPPRTTVSDDGAKALANALANNPVTGPYAIKVETRKGKYVLKGKVGSSDIHTVALQVAIASGLPFSDELVTDTGEAYRSAVSSNGPVPMLGNSPLRSSNEWIYPEPLFGRVDEPFAGMEPPAISYPPDWAARNNRVAAAIGATQMYPLPSNTVEMTIDPRGVGLLRGRVPTAADRIAIGQQLAQTPGVTGIINQLEAETGPAPASAPTPAARPRSRSLSDTPPPPPRPMALKTDDNARAVAAPPQPNPPDAQASPTPAPSPSRKINPLETRINQAVQRVPELRGVGIRIKASEGGVIGISGKVAGIREAMLAYRAVQTTPGVTAVLDSLEFPPPDAARRNPLTDNVDPEEAEPYLAAQVARQLGEIAHVDRLKLNGDQLELRATLDREDDRARAEAILRSITSLRGFKVDSKFRVRN